MLQYNHPELKIYADCGIDRSGASHQIPPTEDGSSEPGSFDVRGRDITPSVKSRQEIVTVINSYNFLGSTVISSESDSVSTVESESKKTSSESNTTSDGGQGEDDRKYGWIWLICMILTGLGGASIFILSSIKIAQKYAQWKSRRLNRQRTYYSAHHAETALGFENDTGRDGSIYNPPGWGNFISKVFITSNTFT